MHTRLRAASALLAAVLIVPLACGLAVTPVRAAPAPAATQPGGARVAAPLTDGERGVAALRYLRAAQSADGSIDASIAETSDFVIGAASLGYDPATLRACSGKTALDFIATSSDAAATDAAKTGKAILAAVAAGKDPAAFGGRNLPARLGDLYHPATGEYGDGSTFAQSFAILGLRAAGRSVPAGAVSHLEAMQDKDGSWNFQKAANSTQGDSNSTAVALMALVAAGDRSRDATALAYLHTQQLSDGGFAYQNPSPFGPAVSDPNSDGLVIQALIAAGQDPVAAAWSKGSNNGLTHLRASQDASGGFAYPGTKPNAFTTSPIPAALAGKPYAAALSFAAEAAVTGPSCAAPSPTPSAKPTARASAAATATTASTGATSPRPTPPATSTGGGRGPADGDGAPLVALLGAALLAGLLLLARPFGKRR